MGTSNMDVVREYLASWHTKDPDRILANFTDDVVYHDIPLEPHHGIERLARRVKTFCGFCSEAEIVVHDMAESASGQVLTERTDRMKINGRWLEMRLMSVATIRDGKIAGWRDFWDAKTYERLMTDLLGFPHRIEDLETM